MLTYDDAPTIRHAILKRLDPAHGEGERGVKVCEIKIEPHLLDAATPHIAVGVLATIDGDDGMVVRSVFHLPPLFELRHVHNEIDEIAESYKSARLDFAMNSGTRFGEQRTMLGTGLRGRWANYG